MQKNNLFNLSYGLIIKNYDFRDNSRSLFFQENFYSN